MTSICDFDFEDLEESKIEKRKVGEEPPPMVQRDTYFNNPSSSKQNWLVTGPIKPTAIR